MKNGKMKRLRQLVLMLFVFAGFIVACNNSTESTSSSANDTLNSSVNNDTTATTAPVTDTGTMNRAPNTTVKRQTTTKKGRASVGVMASTKGTAMKPDKNGVYDMAEVRPAYPGGQSALDNFINNNVEYPQMAIDDNKQGTVNVQFIVDENGKVTDAKAVGGNLGDGLDDEAVRVISKMPRWEPGKVKGKSVKTRLTLPITYQIEE